MAQFEALAKQQKETGEVIESIVRNYKKDSASRKQTLEYYQQRLKRLDQEWAKFEQTDNEIRLLENPPLSHDYFAKNYYDAIMDLVHKYKEHFEQAMLNVQTPTRTPVDNFPVDKQQTVIQNVVYTSGENNDFTRLIRRQGAMMNSLKRSLDDNLSAPCHSIIKKLWENIEGLHFTICEIYDEPTQQGYNMEQYVLLESRVRNISRNELPPPANTTSFTTTRSEAIPLPKISIPKFDGNYLKWQEFKDLFSQLVANQPLSQVQKMWYLKSHLVGEAGNLIKHFSATGENFEAAWTVLMERYNNKRLMVNKLITELLATPKSTSLENMKRLHDTTRECLLALKNLQIDTSSWSPILLHLLLNKLDQETRIRFEQSLTRPRELQSTDQFLKFLENHFQSLEAIGIKAKSGEATSKVCTSVTSNEPQKESCSMCRKGKHPLFACREFLQQTPSVRFQFVQKQKYCHNCLKPGHVSKNCSSRGCTTCNKKHNTLLHFESSKKGSSDIPATPLTQTAATSTTETAAVTESATSLTASKQSKSNSYILLSTAMITVKSNGKELQCRAILDSGSQVNFVTERLVKRLGICTKPSSININGIGSSHTKVQRRVHVTMQSRISGFTTPLEAAVLPHIIAAQPSQKLNIDKWPIPSNVTLADPSFNRPDKIDVLLGAEFYHQLMVTGQIKLADELPILQNTVLGWIIAGKISGTYLSSATCGICTENEENLEEAVARLWKLEDVTTTEGTLSTTEKQCEQHFSQNTAINKNGRFTVKIPFHSDPHSLGESHEVAYNRFLSLERRLSRAPQVKTQYTTFMKEYENLGHMTEINIESVCHPKYFIPHHCILRPESRTTKLRVVFDASTKTSSGLSLNDIMYTGPTVQSELFSILLRFRLPRFVFTTDVEKMYRQIMVHPDDRRFQIIMWRKDPTTAIKYYQLNTVTYGTRSAPYLATKCLQKVAKENMSRHPLGAQFLQDNFYVDDGIGGSDSLSTTLEIQRQLIQILKQHGFNLQKWYGNHPNLLQNVGIDNPEVDIDFDSENSQAIKTLGLTWMPKLDKFCVKVCLGDNKHTTKRTVSSDLARLFDPLGVLAPIVVMAKIFIQDLWQLKLTWDEALPAELHTRWMTFRNDLEILNNMKFSRHVFEGQIPSKIQLHCFSDASEKAYGAAIYLRSSYKDGRVMVRLLCAKSRVAPLKRQTLPRLELCASVLGAQLTARVKKDLKLEDVPTYLWTDSQIVLAWINSPSSSYQTFVANRISAIQDSTLAEQWRHISSRDNPADVLSRGLPPRKLETCNLWFYGPLFLHGREDTWPQKYIDKLSIGDESVNMEKKKVTTSAVTTAGEDGEGLIYKIRHNGSFKTLQRVIGYILRFINNARKQPRQSEIPLTVCELENSLMVIVRTMQQSDFEEDIRHLKKHKEISKSSSLANLSPFLDNNGIMRVGGRLQASTLSYDAKHQMILPYNDPLAKLLLKQIHTENFHCGPQALLANTRQRFWPIKAKIMARAVVQNCIRCTKVRPKLLTQIMGNLPATRVTPARPFINSGVDFCGPFWVHFNTRGKKPQKSYIAVFCCFATKAVHLELVSDLTTEAFLGALKRFISRRGHCQNLYCDNATNFVGAKNELEELARVIHSNTSKDAILKECGGRGITFHFIPPRAPHFGGLWEAAVKSAKQRLVSTTSTRSLTYEQLETVVIEIEGILNSRPISPMSTDPNDLEALTPGHFLIGEPLNAKVDIDGAQRRTNLSTRWKEITSIKEGFWKQWQLDYLNQLQVRNKWQDKRDNINVGDMVIIKEDHTPTLQWPLGRIIKTFEGDDGVVRVAEIKTAKGTCKRPIHRLAPLPVNNDKTATSPNQDIESNEVPAKKRRTHLAPGLVTLLITLLILPLALGAQVQNRRFGSKLGIHFEEIGTTSISTTEWELIIYFDLTAFQAQLVTLSNGTAVLQHLCQRIREKGSCQSLVAHLENTEAELQLDNLLLKSRHNSTKSGRSKRGAIDVIGNVANSLFGILDSEYAEKMSKTITQVKNNEEHLLQLLKNQTSIVDSTINILKQDQMAVKEKFDSIDRQIIEIFTQMQNYTEERHQEQLFRLFTTLAMQVTIITNNLQRMQFSIIDVLTDTHNGQISPLLLSPKQLQQEVDKIKFHLPASVELPVNEEDLLQLYKLMKIKGGLTTQHVVFSLSLPLIEHEKFDLFNMVAIPNWINKTMITIHPCSSILAVNSALGQYFPMSNPDLKACRNIKNDVYLCSKVQTRYSNGAAMCSCEINLFNKNTKSNCQLRKTLNGFTWIPLHNKNQWMYATSESSRATAVCGKEITQLTLKGSGLLSLQADCILQHEFVTIQTHNSLVSEAKSIFTSLGDVFEVADAEQLKPLFESFNATTYTAQINNLTALQSSLDTQKLSELPNQIEVQNIHHTTVGYSALFIAVGIVAYILVKWILKRRTLQTQATVLALSTSTASSTPTPMPRQKIETSDFTIHI